METEPRIFKLELELLAEKTKLDIVCNFLAEVMSHMNSAPKEQNIAILDKAIEKKLTEVMAEHPLFEDYWRDQLNEISDITKKEN